MLVVILGPKPRDHARYLEKHMNIKKLASAALGVVFLSSFAQANDVFDFTTQTLNAIDAFGDVDNQIVDGPISASNYVMPAFAVVNSLTLTEIATATFGSEFQVRVFFAAAPTLFAQLQPTSTTGYTTSLSVVNSTRPLTGSLVGTNIVAGQQWRMEIADTTNDGTAGISEQTATNFKFTLGLPPAAQSFTISGNTTDIIGDPSNTVLSLGTYGGAAYRVGDEVRVSGGTVVRAGAGANSEARIVLRNSANPGYRLVIAPSTLTGTTGVTETLAALRTVSITNLTPTLSPSDYAYNLRGALIPSGSTWTAELAESVENGLDATEATLTNVEIGMISGTFVPPTAATPATFTDLGSIDESTAPLATPLSIAQPTIGVNNVLWFKFTTPGFNQAGKFLDIYGTLADGVLDDEDTEMALFDNNGLLIANDDDDAVGFLSLLSIGHGDAPRAPIAQPDPLPTNITIGNSAAFDGRDGDGLVAGTYWLAVSRWSATFFHGFVVTPPTTPPTGTNPNQGDWKLNFRTNVVGGSTISGNLTLENTGDDGAAGTESIGWTLSNGTNTYTGSVSVDDFGGGAYTLNVPAAAPNGSYTLVFKGGSFLGKTLNVTLTGASLTGQNATLKNGDIDQDGEVGPSDFEAVVAQFGGPGDADVDNDGEVGPSDFETIVANFGLGDE
jgi:hypothetical protein